ncbi:helix-turn-helix domain-containing protein [Asticcacaulis sp.]|uniref:helix-turn-helix domain-containing protein n=1 Tax=Asticcacaulis sp. TaxID=1872648 RepID=UPI0031DD0F36
MSAQDNITVLEDEAYTGLFLTAERDAAVRAQGQVLAGGRVQDQAQPLASDPETLGTILRSTREAQGFSLEYMADMTRVKRGYLEALEDAAYDRLPSRAFSIGFVKAYAKALGLDEESLADLFKRSFADPAQSDKLRAPVGAAFEDLRPSYRLYGGIAAALVLSVVAWNLFQRTPGWGGHHAQSADLMPQKWSPGVPLVREKLLLTQSAPAPKDQDLPVPYYTPGLEEGFAAIDAERAEQNPAAAVGVPLQMRKAFNPRGAVFGATPADSMVTIQAQRSVNLVISGTDKRVYFARQLGPGEAYRLPQVSPISLLIDVGDPKAFEIYYNGEFAGVMEERSTSVSKLNARAGALAKLMDAQMEALRPAGRDPAAGETPAATAPARVVPAEVPVREGPIPYVPPASPSAEPATDPAPPQP